jgi:biopolymer transport protein ExbB/TolQ
VGNAIVLAASSVLVGLLALVGTLALVRVQRKTAKNEERLREVEAYDLTYNNLRADYDRVMGERDRVTAERDDWRRRALRSEGQYDQQNPKEQQ